MRRIAVTLLTVSSALLAAAQTSPEAEAALAQVVQVLEEAPSYRFSYSFPPSADATSHIRGEGAADLTAGRWRYTVQSDPNDPDADRSRDGEWISTGSAWFHDGGSGWGPGAMDFTYAGVTGILAPFASYETLLMLAGSEEAMQEIALVGRETVDGMEADHYRFSIEEMPVYGTGQYDLWVSRVDGEIERVILAITQEGEEPSRVTFREIGEPVDIEVPQP